MDCAPESSERILVKDYLPGTDSFLSDVVSGLRQSPKRIFSKYFYDQRGCQLFDQICELDEYYPTRTELAIMEQYVPQMAEVIGPRCMLVEFGSGSSVKTRHLLDHLIAPTAYVPVDIAGEHLQHTASRLADRYREIEILPVSADFTEDFSLPACELPVDRCVVYFPGSTIGNLAADESLELLERIRTLREGGCDLLIGLDLQKDQDVLEAAYNDSQGVTAAFNLNVLHRINRELDANFEVSQFRHRAFYNDAEQRIEMHLVSTSDQVVEIGESEFKFANGESICTEYSHKYDIEAFTDIARECGLIRRHTWTDARQYFAVAYFGQHE